MAKKSYRSEETPPKLPQVDVVTSQGQGMPGGFGWLGLSAPRVAGSSPRFSMAELTPCQQTSAGGSRLLPAQYRNDLYFGKPNADLPNLSNLGQQPGLKGGVFAGSQRGYELATG